MRSRVYASVGRPSVCLSEPAGDIDRLLHDARQRGVRGGANAGSATLSAYVVAEYRLSCYDKNNKFTHKRN